MRVLHATRAAIAAHGHAALVQALVSAGAAAADPDNEIMRNTGQDMDAMKMLGLMADHNRWMNGKLYAVCAQLSEAERRRDLGA